MISPGRCCSCPLRRTATLFIILAFITWPSAVAINIKLNVQESVNITCEPDHRIIYSGETLDCPEECEQLALNRPKPFMRICVGKQSCHFNVSDLIPFCGAENITIEINCINEKYFVKCQRKGITLLNMTVGYLLAPGYPDWDSDVYTCRFMSSLNASIKMTYYDSVRRDKNCSCRNEYGQNTSKEIVMERDDYCGGFLIAYDTRVASAATFSTKELDPTKPTIVKNLGNNKSEYCNEIESRAYMEKETDTKCLAAIINDMTTYPFTPDDSTVVATILATIDHGYNYGTIIGGTIVGIILIGGVMIAIVIIVKKRETESIQALLLRTTKRLTQQTSRVSRSSNRYEEPEEGLSGFNENIPPYILPSTLASNASRDSNYDQIPADYEVSLATDESMSCCSYSQMNILARVDRKNDSRFRIQQYVNVRPDGTPVAHVEVEPGILVMENDSYMNQCDLHPCQKCKDSTVDNVRNSAGILVIENDLYDRSVDNR